MAVCCGQRDGYSTHWGSCGAGLAAPALFSDVILKLMISFLQYDQYRIGIKIGEEEKR